MVRAFQLFTAADPQLSPLPVGQLGVHVLGLQRGPRQWLSPHQHPAEKGVSHNAAAGVVLIALCDSWSSRLYAAPLVRLRESVAVEYPLGWNHWLYSTCRTQLIVRREVTKRFTATMVVSKRHGVLSG